MLIISGKKTILGVLAGFNFFRMLSLTKPEKKILIAVLSILTGLCTVAFFLHRNSQRLIHASEKIERVEDFKYHVQEVVAELVDMETGVRGYVLTGDESYLKPANKSIADIFLHLHELGANTSISTEHKDQIVKLQKLVDEKSTLATSTIELRRQKGMKEAIDFMAEGKEKQLMSEIRNITGSILQEEDTQLIELKEKHTNAISHFGITFYFMLLKISITVLTVVTLLVLYFRRRNKAEKMLKESHELFQNVLDHAASIISIKDLSGRYILINQAFESMFEIRKEDVKGKTAFDFFSKGVAEHIRETDLEVIKKQQQTKVEEVVPRHGELIHFVSLKFPLFDANRIPFAICSISTDETEKIQTEQQHKEQMNLIIDLFNNAPCGYQATNKEGTVIEINDTLLKWLGYKREEVIGIMPVKNFLSKEAIQHFTYYFPKIRSGEIKSVFDLETTYIRKDGSKLPIVVNSIAHYDEDDNFIYTRTSVFDISYRKRVEEVAAHN